MRRTTAPAAALCCTALCCTALLAACGGPGKDTTAPHSPAGLSAATGSATSAHVMWDAAAQADGVTGYQVFRDGRLVLDVPAEKTMVDVEGLSPATAYAFTVRAKDAAGNLSPLTAAAKVTTAAAAARDDRAPTAPARLTGRAEDARTVSLVWTTATDDTAVTAYDVYQGGVRIHTAAAAERTARLTGLRPGTSYRFTVRARDAADHSSPDGPALALTTPAAPDDDSTAPVDLLAAVSPGVLELSWSAPGGAHPPLEYELYVNGKSATVIRWGAGAVPTGRAVYRMDTREPAGTVWALKLRARLADGGWGDFSAERSVTLASPASH
ncbi:fibronectin type III domain-containing protein [Streptomyces sp. NPDC089919]|uniref:fibronectin type III domain-containing protein n=1 Tax=Streptomyces sp. NPDC089919 TaxID=3155188 RepID=UPI0034204A06